MTKHIRLDGVVPDALAGSRADQALAKIFPQHSRARIQEWIREGAATLDGAAVRVKDRVAGGERISVHCAVETDEESAAQPGPLAVVYEDGDLLVVDKPAGLVAHPGAGNRDGTLLNRLLAHDPGLRAIPRAGLVHRLDKDTSGLMVIARSLHAHTRLVSQIKAREVERVYEAVVNGSPPAHATVDAPIGRDRVRRTRMAVEARGRRAVTHYRVVERYRRHTRLEVMLETGRTHQIRVHLAHVGHPIVGDLDVREAPLPRTRGRWTGGGLGILPPGPPCPAPVARPSDLRPGTEHREPPGARHARTRRGASRRGRRSPMTACPLRWIAPEWPAPPGVHVVTTTRSGGESGAPYASLNLGTGTGDAPAAVARNRARIRSSLDLGTEPCWLDQVHGANVVRAMRYDHAPRADASVGEAGSPPCAVLTADCLPVVLCDTAGTRVGIAHAGWRGLAGGVIARCVDFMERPGRDLLAWLGPAIGPESYEVGPEVRDACLAATPGARSAFVPSPAGMGRWLADLYAIATRQLESAGVERVYGGGLCTFADESRFFSHRRDGTTGRLATLAWIHGHGARRGPHEPRERLGSASVA